MNAPNQRAFFSRAIFIGLLYCVIGVLFALPSSHVRTWRLAAWVTSAVVYASHITYEQFRLRNSPGSTALHVAVAVAVGGFAVAVAATIHSLFVTPDYPRSRFVVALLLWPIITGVPAFVVALALTSAGSMIKRKRSS